MILEWEDMHLVSFGLQHLKLFAMTDGMLGWRFLNPGISVWSHHQLQVIARSGDTWCDRGWTNRHDNHSSRTSLLAGGNLADWEEWKEASLLAEKVAAQHRNPQSWNNNWGSRLPQQLDPYKGLPVGGKKGHVESGLWDVLLFIFRSRCRRLFAWHCFNPSAICFTISQCPTRFCSGLMFM